jgi:hypothetical protein
MANNVIKVEISPIGGATAAGVSLSVEDVLTFDDASDTVGLQSGDAEGEAIVWRGGGWNIDALDSDEIKFQSSGYPNIDNVRDAILQILFVEAQINSFQLNGQNNITLEAGDSISGSIDLSWAISKAQSELDSLAVSSADIDANFGVIDKNSSSPVTVSLNSAITANGVDSKSVQLAIAESRPDGSTANKTAQASVRFRLLRYFGNASSDTPNETLVKGLAGSNLGAGRLNSVTVDGAGNYIYLAWPKSFGDAGGFKVGGFETTFIRSEVDVTNAFGVTKTYYVYRSLNTTSGSNLNVEVL